MYFDHPGKDNTVPTLKAAAERVGALGIAVGISSAWAAHPRVRTRPWW